MNWWLHSIINGKNKKQEELRNMSAKLKNAINENDHILGTQTAPIELVEYGDYQCPSCGDSYLVVNKLLREMTKRIVFVFRNFPLTDMHPDAFDAALAAEAAALQNKYWKMYDLLYRNRAQLSPYRLNEYAKEIGLDMGRFNRDVQSPALSSKIDRDIESGLKSGVNGTPTFYINGEKYEGDWENDEMIDYIKSLQMSRA
jgi:protein-disulfide isomerase